MNIEKIDIKYARADGFDATTLENECHIKILPWLSVVQSVEGSYDIQLANGKARKTGDGGFFIAPANVQQKIVHHRNPESKTMRFRWIFLDVVINEVFRPDVLYNFPLIVPEPQRTSLHEIFNELFSSTDPFEHYICYYRILKLLFGLAVPREAPIHKSMQETLLYLQQHYTEPICIQDLASNAHMSPSNFYAVFKKQFGISPIAYLNQYRISLASEEIRQTDKTIVEIATSVGIPDALYFSKLFRSFYQISPREYRKNYRT